MNTTRTAVVLAILVASPSFAHPSRHAQYGSINQPAVASDVVTESGRYIGQDPDANIRAELRRDSSSYVGDD
jgi:hypothetical protein